MLSKISNKICKSLIRRGTVTDEYEEIYIYGIELLLSFIFSVTVIMIIGIIINRPFETVLFLTIFIFTRKFTGGFHANTYMRCQICTISSYLLVLCSSLYVDISLTLKAIMTISGIAIVALIGPIENPNKPIAHNSIIKYKLMGTCIYACIGTMGLLCYNDQIISNIIVFSLVLVVLLMVIPYFERRLKNDRLHL